MKYISKFRTIQFTFFSVKQRRNNKREILIQFLFLGAGHREISNCMSDLRGDVRMLVRTSQNVPLEGASLSVVQNALKTDWRVIYQIELRMLCAVALTSAPWCTCIILKIPVSCIVWSQEMVVLRKGDIALFTAQSKLFNFFLHNLILDQTCVSSL